MVTSVAAAHHGAHVASLGDARAKADQQRRAEACGGTRAILERGAFVYTPPPGTPAEFLPTA
jgi:hypothetical protein